MTRPGMDDFYDPPDDPLDIIHMDHEVLVVNKPSGLLSVPGKGEHLADCLIARLRRFPIQCKSQCARLFSNRSSSHLITA
mgnify:CR=1 FL=1